MKESEEDLAWILAHTGGILPEYGRERPWQISGWDPGQQRQVKRSYGTRTAARAAIRRLGLERAYINNVRIFPLSVWTP